MRYWPDIESIPDGFRWAWAAAHSDPAVDGFTARQTRIQPLAWNSEPPRPAVKHKGCNPYGEVASAVMMAKATFVSAKLVYEFSGYWATNKLPLSYKLEVMTHEVGVAWAGLMRVLREGGKVEIPFLADYALCVDGAHHVPDGAAVALLLVHSSPQMRLVLKPCGKGYTWERIGIARISATFQYEYRLTLLKDSKIGTFRIL